MSLVAFHCKICQNWKEIRTYVKHSHIQESTLFLSCLQRRKGKTKGYSVTTAFFCTFKRTYLVYLPMVSELCCGRQWNLRVDQQKMNATEAAILEWAADAVNGSNVPQPCSLWPSCAIAHRIAKLTLHKYFPIWFTDKSTDFGHSV